MVYEKSCGAVVFTRINEEIKYVLVQQLDGFYGFPKGHVEGEETEKETARREIYEEVGLKPTIIDGFVTTDEHIIPKKKDIMKQIIYFLAEYKGQKLVIQKEELLNAKIVSYEKAINMLNFESSKRILNEANDFLMSRKI